jgi:hypothetical protein
MIQAIMITKNDYLIYRLHGIVITLTFNKYSPGHKDPCFSSTKTTLKLKKERKLRNHTLEINTHGGEPREASRCSHLYSRNKHSVRTVQQFG